MGNSSVADLLVLLHSNIDSIHQCVESFSEDTRSQDEQMERLERERETKIKDLAMQHENEAQALAEQRVKEEEELAKARRKEDEELMERRRREDEARKVRYEKEELERFRLKRVDDEKRDAKLEEKRRSVSEGVEAELERLEDEMERKYHEGKKTLAELDEKRKAINAQIEAALNTPTVIPKVNFRSRARTRGKSVVEEKAANGNGNATRSLHSEAGAAASPELTSAVDTANLSNGHTDDPPKSIAKDLEQKPASKIETRQVSEATPKDGQHTETDLVDSESKSQEDTKAPLVEAFSTSLESPPQEKELDTLVSKEDSKTLELPHEVILPTPEPTNGDGTQSIEIEKVEEIPPAESKAAAKMEEQTSVPKDTMTESKDAKAEESKAESAVFAPSTDTPNSDKSRVLLGTKPTGSSSARNMESLLAGTNDLESEGNSAPVDGPWDPKDSDIHKEAETWGLVVEVTSVPIDDPNKSESPLIIEENKFEEPITTTIESHNDGQLPAVMTESDKPTAERVATPKISKQPTELSHTIKQVTDVISQELHAERSEPRHEDITPSEITLNGSNVESKSSETRGVSTTCQKDDNKPTVIEDHEDVKAREEIARLNAELMKEAIEKENSNKHLVEERKVETDVNQRSPELDHSAFSHTHHPETPFDELSVHGTLPDEVKSISESSDFAIDVQPPPSSVIDNSKNDKQLSNPSSMRLDGDQGGAPWASPRAAEDTNHAAMGLSEQSGLSTHFEPKIIDTTHLSTEDTANDDLKPKMLEHENKESINIERPLNLNKHSETNPFDEDYHDFQSEDFEHSQSTEKEPNSHLSRLDRLAHSRTRSLSQTNSTIDNRHELPRAESPVTVLNSDDLFEDDEDEQENDMIGRAPNLSHDDDNHEEDHTSWRSSTEVQDHHSNYEDAFPSPSLHVRTHTSDTVPSFENYAQSDYSIPSTLSDTTSIRDHQNVDEPMIRDSWASEAEELDHHEGLKPAASPLQQLTFDPFNNQGHSYAPPKSGPIDPQIHEAEAHPESTLSHFESQQRPESPVQAQRYPHLDSSHTVDVPEGKSYALTISTTKSLQHESPTYFDFSTDPIPPTPPLRSPRRPRFQPPSSLAKAPIPSPSIPSNNFFQKTRSLFETSLRQETKSTPPLSRQKSTVFSTPSPPPKPLSLKSRPSSLSMRFSNAPTYNAAPTSPIDEPPVPKLLDRNRKPPSPAFGLPRDNEREEEDYGIAERRSSSFLSGISKLGGLVGLEASMHNPTKAEGTPLLSDERRRNGY